MSWLFFLLSPPFKFSFEQRWPVTVQPGSRSQNHVPTFSTKFWHSQTFQTKIRHVQTFATKTWHFLTFATMMIRRDFRDRSGGGATKTSRLAFGVSRLSPQDLPFPDFCDRKTQARLSRLRWIRRDAADQETARPALRRSAISRLSRPRWSWRDFSD